MIDKKDYRATVAFVLAVVFQFSGKWAILFYAFWWLAAWWFSDDENTEGGNELAFIRSPRNQTSAS